MEVIVHRGTRQIGGCVTEVRTAATRIILDFGSDLPPEPRALGPEPLRVEGVNCGQPRCDAVLFSHYHGDHVGRIHEVLPEIPLFMGPLAQRILLALKKRLGSEGVSALERACTFQPLKPLPIGEITITPIPTDHSAFDAYMFLLEAGGKRILHTGDFRFHGFRGRGAERLIQRYVGRVDLLITEGTLLKGSGEAPITEYHVQAEIAELIRRFKYVFVLCSSTNIDRLALLHNNTPRGRYFVCDSYQREIFDLVKDVSRSGYYQFSRAWVYGQNLDLEKQGFVMPVRKHPFFKGIMDQYAANPQSWLVYSMWKGYLDGRDPELEDLIRPFAERGKVAYVHSSGHAVLEDIRKLVEWTSPALVLPIHTEFPQGLAGIGAELVSLRDGEVLDLRS